MSKAKASILAGMLAATIFVSGCANQGALGGGEKVAVVNGTTISKVDFDKTYGEFEKAFHLDAAPQQQREAMGDTLKQMTLNKLILQTLIFNEATKDGIKVTDADVDDYKKKKIFSNPAMAEQFQAFLKQNNMKESDFDAMLKDNLLLNKFMDAKGGPAVQVSDADVQAYYAKNTAQFKIPARIHASHILVKAIVPQMKQELRSKNAKITDAELDKEIATKKEEMKAKADKLFAEVKADPAKFETLAKSSSDDTLSAQKGGDLGFMAENSIDPTFWAAAAKTPDGQMYPGVVASQFGYHIIKVMAHEAPHQQTFAEAKEMIREHMSQEKKQAFLQTWAEAQKATAKIEVEPAYKPKAETAGGPGGMTGGNMQAVPATQTATNAAPAAAPAQQAKQ
jgi:parvulin-like peptidyl-prolyl isomerase